MFSCLEDEVKDKKTKICSSFLSPFGQKLWQYFQNLELKCQQTNCICRRVLLQHGMMLFSSLLVLMFQQIQIKLNNRQLERCRWWYFRLDCQFIICFWPCTNVGYGIFLHICSWVQHFYHAIVKYDIFFDNEVKSWKSILFYNNILIFIIIFFGYFNKSLFHIQFTSLQLKICRMHVSNKFQEMITELLSTSFCSVAIGILSQSSVHAWIL